jgi:streptogramin lyase
LNSLSPVLRAAARRLSSGACVACIVSLALGLLLHPDAAGAVSPKYWIHETAAEFLAGDPRGISVMSGGTLRLAPELDLLAEIDEPYLWDLAVDPRSGDVYVGTGDQGRVYRVRSGHAEIFVDNLGIEVFSVAVSEDGHVFAGTAPEGFIYRIEEKGDARLLFDAEESYPWDLAFGPDGMLYAAMGVGGAVYRIDPESGKAERFFSTEDNHVVCLAFADNGDLLVGTEGRGLVIRVTPKGDSHVLHDFPQGEIGAVLPGPDGEIWVAAAATAPVRETKTPEESSDGGGPAYGLEVTPATAGDGVLYRIDRDGNPLRLWESGQAAIYDLWRTEDGQILAVTGEEGGIYSVEGRGRATLVLAMEEEQVVGIAPAPKGGGILLATANPSRVYRLGSAARDTGEYDSEVLDARFLATWGRIEWKGEENGGRVELFVRSGNTDDADASWSEWKRVQTRDGAGDVSEAEKARFFQWRVKLGGGGKNSPLVRRVRVSSLENNLPPLLADVRVVPSGTRFYVDVPELRPHPLFQSLPGGVKVQYSFDNGADQEYPPEDRAAWTQGLRQIQWDAIDPNDDFLVFDLAYRSDDETRWKTFAEDVDGKLYTFNARGIPDGTYRIRVTASDRRFNPGNERTTEMESEDFLIDNTAPVFEEVKHRLEDTGVRITGVVQDGLSDVARLEYSVDGGEWQDVRSQDAIFDSKSEEFEVVAEVSAGEEHAIVLRGMDVSGNVGSTRVLIQP